MTEQESAAKDDSVVTDDNSAVKVKCQPDPGQQSPFEEYCRDTRYIDSSSAFWLLCIVYCDNHAVKGQPDPATASHC